MLTLFGIYANETAAAHYHHACLPGVWCGCSVDHMRDIPPHKQLVFSNDRVYCCPDHGGHQHEDGGQQSSMRCMVCVHDGAEGYHFMVDHMTPMARVYDIVRCNRSVHENTPFLLYHQGHPIDKSAVVVSSMHLMLRMERTFC